MAALRASTPHIGSLSAPTVADLDTQHACAAGSIVRRISVRQRMPPVFIRGKECNCPAATCHTCSPLQYAYGKGVDWVTDIAYGLNTISAPFKPNAIQFSG
jgi:hypothetical protein